MASIAALAARQAATLTRLSSPKTSAPAAHLIQRRGLAGAAGNFLHTFIYRCFDFSRLPVLFAVDQILKSFCYFIV